MSEIISADTRFRNEPAKLDRANQRVTENPVSETKRAAVDIEISRVSERDRSEPVYDRKGRVSTEQRAEATREQIDAIVSEREAAQNEQRAATESRAENRTQS